MKTAIINGALEQSGSETDLVSKRVCLFIIEVKSFNSIEFITQVLFPDKCKKKDQKLIISGLTLALHIKAPLIGSKLLVSSTNLFVGLNNAHADSVFNFYLSSTTTRAS